MTALLLVTGSRLLADHPRARAWAEAEMGAELAELGPRAVVLSGEARGADEWATALASARGLRWVVFHADGWRQGSHDEPRLWRTEGPLTPEELRAEPRHFLARDEALVDAALAAHERRWRVRVLGLKARWSTTGGTDYTLREAQRAGLVWRRAEVTREGLDAWGWATPAGDREWAPNPDRSATPGIPEH